jgi:predicted secreted protein
MNPATVTLTFVMLWWLIFFMALPIGVKRDESPQAGNAIGAPKNGRIVKKMIITTIITIILTFAFFYLLSKGYLDFMSPRV